MATRSENEQTTLNLISAGTAINNNVLKSAGDHQTADSDSLHASLQPLFSQTGNLYPTPPFDIKQSMAYLGLALSETSTEGKALLKAISINNQAILFQVSSTGTVDSPLLSYTLFSEKAISQNTRHLALDRIRFFLSLTDDLNSFYRIGYSDPHFQPIIQRLYGYHQGKFLTPFESACWALLAGNTSVAEARLIKRRLMRHFGRQIHMGNRRYYAFPEADALAYTSAKELTSFLFNDEAANQLLAAARAFHEIDDEFLTKAPYDDVSDWLQRLDGLDTWAASFILLQGLGRMERAPITDRRLITAATHFYGDSLPKRISLIANQYNRWQGYWAHYLRVAI